jgi:uncharacterized protein YggE
MSNSLPIALSIFLAALMLAGVGFIYTQNTQAAQKQQARDEAVDGCMQNATFTWQEQNQQFTEVYNTSQEPSRFWYKICMQEKGYEVRAEI